MVIINEFYEIRTIQLCIYVYKVENHMSTDYLN